VPLTVHRFSSVSTHSESPADASRKNSCPIDQFLISDFVLTSNMERAQNLAWHALTQVTLALQWHLGFYILATDFYL